MSTILDAARQAVRAGLVVLPTRSDGTKAPALASWAAFKDRRPTLEERRQMGFATAEGLGLVATHGVEAWDFDEPDVFDLFLKEAAATGLGDLVARIRAGYEDATPRGGRRWLVTYPEAITWRDETLAARPNGDGKDHVLIELPTHAVLAPSHGGVHPTGKPYVHVSGDFTTIASYTADERDALITLARRLDERPRRQHAPQAARKTVVNGARPGDDYNARTTWQDVLGPHDWQVCEVRGDVTQWTRPGKDCGCSATTNHAGSDLLWVFSSSTAFDADRSYDKFGAYAVLEHGGDLAAAARSLANLGYGQPAARKPGRERTPGAQPTPAANASWRWLADVQREYVQWLWLTRLALGTLALWIGDGGLGKSRASNDVAARVTTGARWPDGGYAEPGNVIILSAEDSASYTIRPAIEAAGGDVSKIAILDAVRDDSGVERTFNLATDLAALEALLDATQASLLIIDPLSAYFGTALDSYRDTDVRSVLEPIVKLAERRHVAVLGIMHVGKGTDRQARHRALGSVAFVNAARLVFAVGPDPADPERRLLVPVKANLCREAVPLAFRLEDASGVAKVVWETAPVAAITADQVLNARPGADEDHQDAEHVIRTLLDDEDWPLDARMALAAGRAHGIPERTMQRTAKRLGLDIRRLGFGSAGRWQWHRPSIDATGTAGAASDDPITATTPIHATIDDIDASVCSVASMENMASMEPPIDAMTSMASITEQQQIIHKRIDDSGVSTRARGTPIEALPVSVTTPGVGDLLEAAREPERPHGLRLTALGTPLKAASDDRPEQTVRALVGEHDES